MSTIIWKEIRENFKWVILAFAVMAFAMWTTLGSDNHARMLPGQPDATHILSSSFLLMTTVGGALYAGLLGFRQVIFEARPDQWAFLVHRPIPLTTIFLGKAISGLALYVLGFGMPLAAVVIWASLPGSYPAPFEWAMALPALADFLNGTVYYFAGMLTGLRQARWYGSRCFGILAAVAATFGVMNFSPFWYAALISLIVLVLSAFTAWGSFLSCGRYSDQPRLGKVALTAFFVPGALAIVATVMTFAFVAAAQGRFTSRSYTYYQIMKSGSVLKLTTVNSQVVEAVDLNGDPFPPSGAGDTGSLGNMSQQYLPVAILRVGDQSERFGRGSYRSWRTFFVPLSTTAEANWCYSRTGDRILGYSPSNNRLIGSIGPDGFVAGDTERPDRFEPPNSWNGNTVLTSGNVLHFHDGIYRLALENRRVVRIFTPGDGDRIIGSTTMNVGGEWNNVAVATEAWIQILDMEGETVLRFDNAHSHDDYQIAYVGKLPNEERFAFLFKTSRYLPSGQTNNMPELFQVVSRDGTAGPESQLPLLPVMALTLSPLEQAASGLTPPVVVAFFELVVTKAGRPFQPIALFISIVIGLLCAVGGALISRRFAFSKRRTAGWALFNTLLGIPGFLTFLSIHEWPVREPCESCGKLRVVTREECECCGAGFPSPPRDGTEIFESGSVEIPVD